MTHPQPLASLEAITQTLKSVLPELRDRYGVLSLGVFGSYVRGEQTPDSDLDLLVEFDHRPLTLLQFIALEYELSDRLQIRVDLVEKKVLKPTIGKRILQEVVPL
ncbi:MAG: nucleotidyltransferase family protein [Leptolyngbyaceae cyanobacterium SL_7_1]|nr:nucleotidyltransferase family protein [Leptolyngbyaceae cyanobacterium SL_7_1]